MISPPRPEGIGTAELNRALHALDTVLSARIQAATRGVEAVYSRLYDRLEEIRSEMSEQFPQAKAAIEKQRGQIQKLAERLAFEIEQVRAAFEKLTTPVDEKPLVDAIDEGTARLEQLSEAISTIIPDEPVPEPLPEPPPEQRRRRK